MTESADGLLQSWLLRQLPDQAGDWLGRQLDALRGDPGDRTLHILLGMIPRRLGKADLALGDGDLADADTARAGWDPSRWSVDVAARTLTLLTLDDGGEAFAKRFSGLCATAELAETIALYCGLPLYPAPALLEPQAAEGLRTNMRAAFEAVAHRNPFPRERFAENRWNHMVLKAVFIGSSLAPIQGLDERANPELARILCDYAHERWSAGRPVTPELWRCVGPHADDAGLADLERVLTTGGDVERRAAALAVAANPAAAAALRRHTDRYRNDIESGALTWNALRQDM